MVFGFMLKPFKMIVQKKKDEKFWEWFGSLSEEKQKAICEDRGLKWVRKNLKKIKEYGRIKDLDRLEKL